MTGWFRSRRADGSQAQRERAQVERNGGRGRRLGDERGRTRHDVEAASGQDRERLHGGGVGRRDGLGGGGDEVGGEHGVGVVIVLRVLLVGAAEGKVIGVEVRRAARAVLAVV